MDAFEFLNIDKNCENGKPMTVSKMKEKLLNHTTSNPVDKESLDTFLSKGEKPSDINYTSVQKTVWLNKNPKDWCPSPNQIHNLYGRCVLTALLFSIPAYFPPKIDLDKFGYRVEGETIIFDLTSSLCKEKNVRMLLARLGNKGNKAEEKKSIEKRTHNQTNRSKKNNKKRKPNSPEKLID